MYLTATNLAHCLISNGLVTAQSIVEGDFTVVEAGRRNRNFKVLRKRAPGLFVKQIKTSEQQATFTLRKEAEFYQRVQMNPAFAPIAAMIPAMLRFEPARHAVFLRLTPDAESLFEYQLRTNDFGSENAGKLGNALAILHAFGPALAQDPSLRSTLPGQLPWAMTLDQQGSSVFQNLGPIGTQIATLLQGFPTLAPQLCALRHEWQFETVIHGDMKWENCLLYPEADGQHGLQIVDWELVDVGDGAWDVATIFKEYLVLTIITADSPQRKTLDDLRPSMREFWKSYAGGRRFTAEQAARFRERAVRFTAARMLVAVAEYLYGTPQAIVAGTAMLQTAASILASPQTASMQMLGHPA